MNTNMTGLKCFQTYLRPCALKERSFTIGRVSKGKIPLVIIYGNWISALRQCSTAVSPREHAASNQRKEAAAWLWWRNIPGSSVTENI